MGYNRAIRLNASDKAAERIERPPRQAVMPLWMCEICKTIYTNQGSAEVCALQGFIEAPVRVGDFCVTEQPDAGRFGWFDGDAAWVIEKPAAGVLIGMPHAYSLVYVVTHITHEGHDWRVHLQTKGMSGEQGYRAGWVSKDHFGRLYPAKDIARERGLDAARIEPDRHDDLL